MLADNFFFNFKILYKPIKTYPQAPSLYLCNCPQATGLRKLFTPTGPHHSLLPRGMRGDHYKEKPCFISFLKAIDSSYLP